MKKEELQYHYTYRIINMIINKEYIGVRTSRCIPTLDLGIKYFSSSADQDFMLEQQEYPHNFKYKVMSIHPTRTSAEAEEMSLHKFFNVKKDKKYYNRTNADFGFNNFGNSHTDETKLKWKNNPKRKQFGELNGMYGMGGEKNPFFGKVHTDEIILKLREYVQDTIWVKNKALKLQHQILPENYEKYSKLGYVKGRFDFSDQHKLRLSEQAKRTKTCPHCGLTCSLSNATRWHFDNCKIKDI